MRGRPAVRATAWNAAEKLDDECGRSDEVDPGLLGRDVDEKVIQVAHADAEQGHEHAVACGPRERPAFARDASGRERDLSSLGDGRARAHR